VTPMELDGLRGIVVQTKLIARLAVMENSEVVNVVVGENQGN